MKVNDIHVGRIYFDGKRNYRFVTGTAAPALKGQTDMDNVAYILVQMREDGRGLSGNGKGRALSCTRASLAAWAKSEVMMSGIPADVGAAFSIYAEETLAEFNKVYVGADGEPFDLDALCPVPLNA